MSPPAGESQGSGWRAQPPVVQQQVFSTSLIRASAAICSGMFLNEWSADAVLPEAQPFDQQRQARAVALPGTFAKIDLERGHVFERRLAALEQRGHGFRIQVRRAP